MEGCFYNKTRDMMKYNRKINLRTLFKKTILYRIFVIGIQVLFTFLYIRNWSKAINISIVWNIVNMGLFFGFSYLFDKRNPISIQTEGSVVWFTGIPCSGKSSIADEVADNLLKRGYKVERLDGDIVRNGKLSDDLGFSKEDRNKNINRINFVSKLLSRNGVIVLASFVSPYRKTRNAIRKNVNNFIEVFVKATPEKCAERDVKGMWAKAKAGEIKGFTGYDDPYEKPINPELICNTEKEYLECSTDKVIRLLKRKGIIK